MAWFCRRTRLFFLVAFVALPLRLGGVAAGESEANCDRDLLVTLHRQIEPTVEAVAGIHFNFTGGRHYEVVEVISVYHVDRLAHSALRYVESLRLTFCVLICPVRFELYSPEDVGRVDTGKFLEQLGLVHHLNQFFADVRHLAAGGDAGSPEAAGMWDTAEQELREISLRLEGFVRQAHAQGGGRLLAETYASFEPLLKRVLSMIVDFLRSLAEDTVTLFNAPNYVAREMTPPEGGQGLRQRSLKDVPGGNTVTVDIFADSSSGPALQPAFARMLSDSGVALSQPSFTPKFAECGTLEATRRPHARGALPPEFLDQPASWAQRDVSGVPSRRNLASPLQLLHAAARHTTLSNLFISVQVAPYLLTPKPSCGSKEVLFDPSHCLIDHNWGGYWFHLNPLPPFNLSVVYAGKPLGPGAEMPPTDVHSIHVPSMDTQWSSLVSTFKSMNHHSPDLLFVNPFVGNCQIVDRLLDTGSVKPKLIYLPINPLEPPPREVTPDFFAWWSDHGEVLLAQLMMGVSSSSSSPAGMPISTSVWLAQCSLSAGNERLKGHGYRLVHVEHSFAVFLWRPLFLKLFGADADKGEDGSLEPLRTAWLRGWQCSPHARYLFDLEVLAGGAASLSSGALDSPGSASSAAEEALRAAGGAAGGSQFCQPRTMSRAELRASAAAVVREEPTMRYFLERPRPGDTGGRGRGHCSEGLCECFPPYRGEMCEFEDPPRVPQKVRAVMHYITAETERDLVDLSRSLESLWTQFNKNFDYPVVVFHEGLSPKARRRIIEASENRVWLALLPKFKEVPAEWAEPAEAMAQDFAVGYRAMTRWRSGPCFLEPALAGFDYAMTLDTDSYIPAPLGEDPFQLLDREGWVAAFPHLGRESASVVVNFMHHFLLYCRLKGLHARRTEMLASLVEKNFKWYQQCLMLDIEVLRLDWFRGDAYQDMFHYMDSTGGFWLHRWGNNPVRTFAVALLLEDSQVRSLDLPYAHQDFCSCGHGATPCKLDKTRGAYVCDEVQSPSGIGVGDLAEGLLDLQPWRGTDRQKKRFTPSDVRNFVAEQMPF